MNKPKKDVYQVRLDPLWIEALKEVAAASRAAPGVVARDALEVGLAIRALSVPTPLEHLPPETQQEKLVPVLLYILRWAHTQGFLIGVASPIAPDAPVESLPSGSVLSDAQRTMRDASADLAAFDLDDDE